ncbi:hypothetical protein NNJEOMEG_04005 [Fundidesulfovibrio magnetotacticus]|uniref:Pyridoxamine 5'-phosphate oxidase N-terminal domain-containing protein n=1 Tax=Fundidesulfovibrio magnetotacticus TaxID=2730080 RepID=A0A6V8LZB6_9BACT|nr:pyridoxamine 5'-phosphate oxidase family protein [Fundidesulfovibrio magnetotacticus]GFK96130.1 hypothetical protein NNJEOMEG_04005 [Fundidesulfovibrio magnetotacticus]
MTREEFEAAALALLDSERTLTLATCGPEGLPWATDVWFARDGLALVFYSSPRSRHCRNLAASPACAATVHARTDSWKEIKGLQMEGEAREAQGTAAKARALAAYVRRYPFAAALLAGGGEAAARLAKVRAHVFRPRSIRLVDNARGFATRYAMRVEDGLWQGEPEAENH